MQRHHLDASELMERVGKDAYAFLKKTFPQVKHMAVYCGSGHNAGDGYVLARVAHEQGLSVIVYQCKALDDLPSAAKHAALLALAAGVECQLADEPLDAEVELIVDALLGIGIKGCVHGMIAQAIHQMNSSGLPILSIDVPSGLNANTGVVENYCVKATWTITYVTLKLGFYTADGPDYCGDIYYRSLHLESNVEKIPPQAFLLHADNLLLPLSARHKNSNKSDFGHVLIIGGGLGMPGAAALAAKAALRSGAGAVTIATHVEHSQAMLPIVPEAMVWGVKTPKALEPLLAKATVCVIGPGLGDTIWAQALFDEAIKSQLPMVIDASALGLLAHHPQVDDNWILTPHPGEAARLLSCAVGDIQSDRYQSVEAIQEQYGGVVVLKGNGTIIHTPEKNTFVCPKGNPGMASAGMGDTLTGVIAGLCAQRLPLSEAAKAGVWVHALAGDLAVQEIGKVGVLAGDLLSFIPAILSGKQ